MLACGRLGLCPMTAACCFLSLRPRLGDDSRSLNLSCVTCHLSRVLESPCCRLANLSSNFETTNLNPLETTVSNMFDYMNDGSLM